MNNFDLKKLPPPTVVEDIDAQQIVSDMLSELKDIGKNYNTEFDIRDSDPAMRLIEVFAYREMMLRRRINSAALQCFVAFAEGANLDHIAALFGAQRNSGPEERDDDFRLRAMENPEKLSTAGSAQGYRRHAMDTDWRITDVGVDSTEPGKVTVAVLPRYGVTDTREREAIRRAVEERLTTGGEDIRPIADLVTVIEAPLIRVTIEAVFHISRGSDKESVLKAAKDRLRRYLLGTYRVGAVLSISGLYSALHREGVERVELHGLAGDIVPKKTEAAHVDGFYVYANGETRPEEPELVPLPLVDKFRGGAQ